MKNTTKFKIISIILYIIAVFIIVYGFAFFESGILKAICIGGGLAISYFSDKIWKRSKSDLKK